jgi:hypothetical protein
MRKQMAGTMIALLAIVLVGTAQTPGTEAVTHAAFQKVNVVRGETGVSIEMVSKGTLAPKVETLSSPARIVVNLPNTTMATSLKRIDVGTGGVAAVRIGADAKATTRVVVDLDRPAKYELVSGANGSLTLKVASPAVGAA